MSLEAEIQAVKSLDLEAGRSLWLSRIGGPPPRLRGYDLMRRALADAIQAQVLGRDADVDRRLAVLVRAHGRGARPSAPKAAFRPGTQLTREHGGVLHRVEVLEGGFRWQGRDFASLSAIARAITGVRWNGPKFFGLRGA